MRTRPLLCLLATATLVTACSGGDDDAASTSDGGAATTMVMSTPPATTTPVSSATTAPAAPATTAAVAGELPMEMTVDISDFTFGPAEIHVAVGATITFVNSDTQAHTATAAGVFDTGNIDVGESATVTVDEAGTIDYKCAYHPFMTGTIVVG
jgi:plastocyanin